MIPIVFWASLVPWPREYAAAEAIWRTRNVRSTRRGNERRSSHESPTVSNSARHRPITGATTMNASVLIHPASMIAPKPALATAAPAYPPMRACDDEVGSAPHQVIRSQVMAPSRPLSVTVASTMLMSIIPFPKVFATAVPKRNTAMKLNAAAQTTANPGERTRVDTTVAIELAASWNPLMKSKASATTMIAITPAAEACIRRASG